jgi:DNA-binding transcriptional LysR family regulator
LDRIRVLVVGSRLLRDIIEEIAAAHPDIEVLEDVPQRAGMEEALCGSGAAVVVCDEDDAPATTSLDELLYRHPLVRMLVIQKGRRGSFLCELRPHRRPLGELGPDGLIAVIRDDADLRGCARTWSGGMREEP